MRFYRQLLVHHWRSITVTVVVCLLLTAISARLVPERFHAEAQLFVGTTSPSQDSAGLNQSGQYVQARVKSYVGLVTTPGVLDPVREALALELTTSELATRVSANVPVDTVLIDVTVTDGDPVFARDVANAVAQQLALEIERLETPAAGGTSQITVVPTRTATLPTTANGQPTAVILGLGVLLGLALGLGVALLTDVIRPRLRDRSDVEDRVGIPVLADLPGDRRGTPRAALKHLRAQLTPPPGPAAPWSLFFTGAEPGTDTARLVLDLAGTFSASGHRVVLVDGDLERRGLTRLTGAHPRSGLQEVLDGTPVVDALVALDIPSVSLLSSRTRDAGGLEIVFSTSLTKVFEDLSVVSDIVIISGASAEEDADALLWARVASGTVVVTRTGAPVARVRSSLDLLNGVHAVVLGFVLQAGRSLGRRPAAPTDDDSNAGAPSHRRGTESATAAAPSA